MSEKLTLRSLNTLANHESALHVLNDNFNDIANKIDTLLSRDGDIPNHMTADLDMNNNNILNVSQLEVDFILVEGENLLSNYYTISETNSILSGYSEVGHGHIWGDIQNIPTYVNTPTICAQTDTNLVCGEAIENNYVLAWDVANQYWTPVEQAGAGGGIGDAPVDSNYYSRINNQWEIAPLEALSDVIYGSVPAEDEVLSFNGSQWTNVNTVVHEVDTPTVDAQYIYKNNAWEILTVEAFNADKLADISYDVTAPMEEYILQYTFANNVLGQWEPFSLDSLQDNPTYVPPGGGEPEPVWGKTSLDAGVNWIWGKAQPYDSSLLEHLGRTDNPHGVTAAQIGAEPADSNILKIADIEDTPISGHTENPISSNWASQHGQWVNVTGGINYAGGNVGIGTASPSEKLEVAGAISLSEGVKIDREGEPYVLFSTSGTEFSHIRGIDSNYLSVTSAAGLTKVLNIHTDGPLAGNVGIGTVSPSEKLHVLGNIKVTGTVIGPDTVWNNGVNFDYRKLSSGLVEFRSTGGVPGGIMPSGYLPSSDIRISIGGNTVSISSGGAFTAGSLTAGDSGQYLADGA